MRRADRIVLPGVGAFADCRRGLDAVPGMIEALDEAVRGARQAVPRHLRRHAADGRARPRARGDAGPRLDRRRGRAHRAARSRAQDPAYGLEHARRRAGRIRCSTASRPGADGLHAYFVHSYHLGRARARPTLVAEPTTAAPVTAIVARDNMAGTQFHPEKSQTLGLAL